MSLFDYYEGKSFLHDCNPLVKLVCNAVVLLGVVLARDPRVPALLIVTLLLATWLAGRVPLLRILRSFAPFFLLGAALVLFNLLFYRGPRAHSLFAWGPVVLSVEALRFSSNVALRMLSLISFALLFVSTTDPTLLVLSLIQQGHLDYRLGYSTLAAYRLAPFFGTEYAIITAAHRLRGAADAHGPLAVMQRMRRYALPLLASAVRKAERVALAMDSRAFRAAGQRTYYHTTRVSWRDGLLLLSTLGLVSTLLVLF
jgi:energy-coupling factor transport system permease protein